MKTKTPVPKSQVATKAKVNREVTNNLPSWIPYVVMAFAFVLYGKAVYNDFTNFDDDFYVLNNPFIRDFSWNGINTIFSSFYQGNYHPFTTLIYLFVYKLFAMNPMPYHLVNVMFHVFNIWLVYKLVEQLSGRQVTALIVSVLFAVHPMHVESVAWVSELKDVLYSSFYLISLSVYLRYLKSGYQMNYYWITLILFVGSLFSKSAAVTLPILLIAIDLYKGRKFDAKAIIEKIPFLILALIFGILAVMSQKAQGSINNITTSYNLIIRFFFLASALAFYFYSVVAPFNLSAMHYYPKVHEGMLPFEYYASLPFILILLWFIIRKSTLRKEILFGVFFFLISISVMLQIVAVGSALSADRYSYISYIGLFYIIGQWMATIKTERIKNTAIGIFSLFVLLFSIQTYARIDTWKDSASLVEDVIEHNKDVYFGYWLRGNLKKGQGDLQGALQDYTRAIQLNNNVDDSYFNRGIIFDKMGDAKAAIEDFSKAIQLNPKSADTYNNRGWAYFEMGDAKSAVADFGQAVSLNPKYAQAYNNRGWVYYKAGDMKAALPDFDKAIELQPEFLTSYFNRAALKAEIKDYAGSFADYNYLLKLQPKNHNIFYSVGMIYLDMGDTANACKNWKNAFLLGNKNAKEMMDKYCE